MKKCKTPSSYSSISSTLFGLESKIRLIKISYKNILCLLCATDCPVFEVKAKISVSEPSDVINQLKIDRLYDNGLRPMFHSETRISFDEIRKTSPLKYWICWLIMQMFFFLLFPKKL